jgi:hypothetical protein
VMATKLLTNSNVQSVGLDERSHCRLQLRGGTHRRKTIGISRRSLWSSTSAYKSDLVSNLPQRPSNAGPYFLMLLGVAGLLFAFLIGSVEKNAIGFSAFVGFIALLLPRRSPRFTHLCSVRVTHTKNRVATESLLVSS